MKAGRQARGVSGSGGRRRAAWGGVQHAEALPCPPAFGLSGRVRSVDCRPLPLSSRVPWCCAPTRGGAPARQGPRRGVGGGLSRQGARRAARVKRGAVQECSARQRRRARSRPRGSRPRVGRVASPEKQWPMAALGGRRRCRADATGRGPAQRQVCGGGWFRIFQRRTGERFVWRRAAIPGVSQSSNVSAAEFTRTCGSERPPSAVCCSRKHAQSRGCCSRLTGTVQTEPPQPRARVARLFEGR